MPIKNTYANAVLDSRPKSFWRLGESSGTTAADEKGANPGTYNGSPTLGVTGATGDGNKAVTFDGVNDYVLLTGLPTMREMTLEAWIFPTSVATDMMFIGSETVPANYFRVTGSKLFLSLLIDGVQRTLVGATTLLNNTFYHVAATFDRVNMKVFLNGVQDGTAAFPGALSWPVSTVHIGRWTAADPRYFIGKIDDVAFYDRPLNSFILLKHANSAAQVTNQKAPLYSRANYMRAGATRADYYREGLVATISGVSQGHKFVKGKTKVTRVLNEQPDKAVFQTFDINPAVGAEVIISNGSLNRRLFGGVIIDRKQIVESSIDGTPTTVFWDVMCADWQWDLAKKRVLKRYPLQAAHLIARDLAASYAVGYSTNRIQTGAPEVEIEFGLDTTVPAAFQQLASRAGWHFDVDAHKRILFFDQEQNVSQPHAITPSNLNYEALKYSQSLSQIRTRILIEGGGGTTTAPVASGSTTMPVDECGWYTPSECDLISGPQRITFTGRSASSGPGNLTGIPASGAGAILYDIKQGDNVNLLVERNDTAAQTALATLTGGDGIREHFIRDNRLSVSSCQERGDGELAMFGLTLESGSYTSRDKVIDAGRRATILLPGRGLALTPVINEVDIWFDAPSRTQRIARFTTAVKIDLADIVRSIGNQQQA